MSDPANEHFIRFQEAGATFEIHSPMTDGTVLVSVTDEHGKEDPFVVKDFEEACRAVDAWLERHVATDDPRRFKGFRCTYWDHEERYAKERAYLTRGALLEMFEDGRIPTLGELIEHMEGSGDYALEIRDGANNLLIERRAVVRERIRAIRDEDLDLQLGI